VHGTVRLPNQRTTRNPGELKVCGGDDKIDYRPAWETDGA